MHVSFRMLHPTIVYMTDITHCTHTIFFWVASSMYIYIYTYVLVNIGLPHMIHFLWIFRDFSTLRLNCGSRESSIIQIIQRQHSKGWAQGSTCIYWTSSEYLKLPATNTFKTYTYIYYVIVGYRILWCCMRLYQVVPTAKLNQSKKNTEIKPSSARRHPTGLLDGEIGRKNGRLWAKRLVEPWWERRCGDTRWGSQKCKREYGASEDQMDSWASWHGK